MADTVDIATAVAATLNAVVFDPTFTAQRSYAPAFALEDLSNPKICVTPVTQERRVQTRGAKEIDTGVEITVQRRVLVTDLAGLDAMANLVEAIADYLEGRTLVGLAGARWLGTTVDPHDLTELHNRNLFASVIQFTYRTQRNFST